MINISKWLKAFSFLILGTALVMELGCQGLPKTKQQICLAKKGVPLMKVVFNSTNAIPAEKTAARELTTYLEKITGAKFEIIEEKDLPSGVPAIYLGHTRFAEAQGIDFSKLYSEESVLRTVGKNLVLAGGRPRGTLYAVYEFLENDLGGRWYTPWCEKVPCLPDCRISALDKRIVPFMKYRDNVTHLNDHNINPDDKAFKQFQARNRMNGPNIEIGEEFGGGIMCAGKSSSHSFCYYFPSDKYFAEHPDYFSMRDGKRVPATGSDGNQLCLTNPDVLRLMIEKVKEDFRQKPDGYYVSVSINDGGCKTLCDCPACRKAAEEEGNSGLLLQFVNAVADGIKDEFPDKFILTLAYNPTAACPKRMIARDNVIIYFCAGMKCNFVYLPTGDKGLNRFKEWAKFCKHIWAWDYAHGGWPYRPEYFQPRTWLMDRQFKFAKESGVVDGIFQENEFMKFENTLFNQFLEMDHWIYAKLLQDPGLDVNTLINDFLEGYYGKANVALRQYIDLIHERLPLHPFKLVDYNFVVKAQQYFDQAETAVKDDSIRLSRVKDMRLALDLATLAYRQNIIQSYLLSGGSLAKYPYKTAVIKQRIMDTLKATSHPYLLRTKPIRWVEPKGVKFVPAMDIVREYTELLCSGSEYSPLPEKFASLPPEDVIDITAPIMGNPHMSMFTYSGEIKHVLYYSDPEAALGLAIIRKDDKHLPMPIGVYDGDRKESFSRDVQAKDIPGPGYHWYAGPEFVMGEGTYVWLTKAWNVQQILYTLYDPANPRIKWKVYASMKWTGPAYPHGKPDEPNSWYLDRLVLVRESGNTKISNEQPGGDSVPIRKESF